MSKSTGQGRGLYTKKAYSNDCAICGNVGGPFHAMAHDKSHVYNDYADSRVVNRREVRGAIRKYEEWNRKVDSNPSMRRQYMLVLDPRLTLEFWLKKFVGTDTLVALGVARQFVGDGLWHPDRKFDDPRGRWSDGSE